MMLRIGHRESHDIDIFLSDPQQLPFLDPGKQGFDFEIRPDDCSGDGLRSLKLSFARIGEIDFIVAGALTDDPTTKFEIDDEAVDLETIPEIITKKIYHRGGSLKPRDIFDVAAAGIEFGDAVIAALRRYPDQAGRALATIEKLNPEFVNRAIAQLAIKEPYEAIAPEAIERSRKLLRSI